MGGLPGDWKIPPITGDIARKKGVLPPITRDIERISRDFRGNDTPITWDMATDGMGDVPPITGDINANEKQRYLQ